MSEKIKVFNGRFIQKKKLSQGSFGVVYLCQDKVTKEHIALKVEKENADMMSLEREIQIIEELRGVNGIPKLYWYGVEQNQNCMAMQLLGRDLAHYLKQFKRFSLKCVCNIAEQVLEIIEEVHKRGVIHRDIKPENIMAGRDPEQNKIYLVDFGISKKFKIQSNHIPYQEHKPFMGTTRYASIAAHKGQELSRKDDLESLGYVFIFLLKGNLPWQNINCTNDKEKTRLVGKLKLDMDTKDLCKGLPNEFQRYMDYVQKLKFSQQPDYKYLIGLFQKVAQYNGFQLDRKFDWIEGTTSTKSSGDQLQQQSINELSSDYLQMGGVLKKKSSDRRRSAVSRQSESGFGSQQSSIFLNYVPSVVHNQQYHFKQREKSNHGQQIVRITSKNSLKSKDSNPNQNLTRRSQQVQEVQDLFYKGENFQDLEQREENLKSQREELQKSQKDQFDIDDLEDEMEGGLSQQIKKVGQFNYHFKDKLADF